jgi:hypothetical protein
LQPVCPREASVYGNFSITAQLVLQCSPNIVTHEQPGGTNLSAFAAAISLLLASDQQLIQILNTAEKRVCPKRSRGPFKKEHIAILICCYTHKHVSIEGGMILGAPTFRKEADLDGNRSEQLHSLQD